MGCFHAVPHLARFSELCRGRPRPCSRRVPARRAVFVLFVLQMLYVRRYEMYTPDMFIPALRSDRTFGWCRHSITPQYSTSTRAYLVNHLGNRLSTELTLSGEQSHSSPERPCQKQRSALRSQDGEEVSRLKETIRKLKAGDKGDAE